MKTANTPLKYYQTVTYGSAAISIQNTNDPGSRIIANSNKINNTIIGLYLIGVKATTLSDVAMGTSGINKGNDTWFDIPAAQIKTPHRGVSLVNCKNISVANNEIQWDYTPTATVLNTIKGIELKATLNSEVKENTITSMAAGVAVFGDCTGSKLLCNKMDACYHGVYLDPNSPTSLLSTQGDVSTSKSFDNKWTNNINTFKVGGTIWSGHTIIWVYDPLAGSDYDPSGASFVFPQPGNSHSNCVTPSFMGAQERNLMFGNAVGDSTVTDGDALEFIVTDKETFYKQAKQDTTILTKGVASDVAFHAEFDSLSQTNIGLYEEVKDSLAAGNNQAALQKLTLIVDQNLMEENKKYVSSVSAVDYNPITDNDADTMDILTNIALIHPFYGGEAVYWARAILNLDVVDLLPPMRKAHTLQQNNNINAITIQGILFPNPANDQVTFSFPNKLFGIITLKIQDKLGRTLQSYLMNNSQITFSTGNYSQGVYQVTIYENDIQIENHKLIIIRN